MDIIPLKCCSRKDNCLNPNGCWLPATTEFFHKNKRNPDGLHNCCKECNYQWYKNNKEYASKRKREYREKNHEKILQQKRDAYAKNREIDNQRSRQWRKNNKEHLAEYEKKRSQKRKGTPEQKEIHRRHYKKNPDKYRVNKQRRRARIRNLPDTFTPQQWIACLEYFNYCCAVCGKQLRDLFGDVKPHADHWIPISYEGDDNPGTVAENMVCLCNDCNFSKQATMPDMWLRERFGTRKANEILARIQAYFMQFS